MRSLRDLAGTNHCGQQGITDYTTENYTGAAAKFDLSAEVAGMFDVIDTMAVFNAALCYEKSGDVDLAVARYKTCEATATKCLTFTSS